MLLDAVCKPYLRAQWVVPPDEDAAFVAAMERVLDLYQKPLNVQVPVVNMDEQPVSLRSDLRGRQNIKLGCVLRVDSEYKRHGTLFTEALRGWQQVSVRQCRTAVDWAEEVKSLLDEVYPTAKRVILVCDNLNAAF